MSKKTLPQAHEEGLINVYNLAQACGVTVPTAYNWCTGKTEPRVSNLPAIREFTNGAVDY